MTNYRKITKITFKKVIEEIQFWENLRKFNFEKECEKLTQWGPAFYYASVHLVSILEA